MSKIHKKIKKECKKRSNCWLFFSKTERGGKCRLCQKEIISNGNTTNLLNHLKRIHTIQWESAMENGHEVDDFSDNMDIESDEDDENQESEINELHRATNENLHHAQGLAYQSSDGQTVIWLHPDVQLGHLPSGLQTLVKQASTENCEKGTVLLTGDLGQKDRAAIIGELIQKKDTTMSVEDEQKEDLDHPLVVSTENVIHQENNIGIISNVITVSSSEDHSYENNPVSSSAPSVMLMKTDSSSTTLSNTSTATLENPTVSSTPKKNVVVTRVSNNQRPILPVSRPSTKNYSKSGGVSQSKSVTSPKEGQSKDSNCGEENKDAHGAPNRDNFNTSNICRGQICASECRHCNSCQPPREDTFDQFGKYIATLLRNIPSKRTACRLQKEIINWVLREQMLYED